MNFFDETPESFIDDELFRFFTEGSESKVDDFRRLMFDPILDKLENSPSIRKKYIDLGAEFIEVNAEMLAAQYPTKIPIFPKKYVDRVIELFGFDTAELRKIVDDLLKTVDNKIWKDFRYVHATNMIHVIVLMYADMAFSHDLRRSARQQIGLTVYEAVFRKWFPLGFADEKIMQMAYSSFDKTWGLVKQENVVNWIGYQVDVSYQYWKTKLSINRDLVTVVLFIGRVRSTINQAMRLIRDAFARHEDLGHLVGNDTDGDDQYVITSDHTTLKNNIVKFITEKDAFFWDPESVLYSGVAKAKNVKAAELHELVTKADIKDHAWIIDTILYVFLSRDGHEVADISSAKYLNKITNMPTQVDRAIRNKPIIDPLVKRYKTTSDLVKAWIILLAFYINQRINRIDH
jgi:hypothetical protein